MATVSPVPIALAADVRVPVIVGRPVAPYWRGTFRLDPAQAEACRTAGYAVIRLRRGRPATLAAVTAAEGNEITLSGRAVVEPPGSDWPAEIAMGDLTHRPRLHAPVSPEQVDELGHLLDLRTAQTGKSTALEVMRSATAQTTIDAGGLAITLASTLDFKDGVKAELLECDDECLRFELLLDRLAKVIGDHRLAEGHANGTLDQTSCKVVWISPKPGTGRRQRLIRTVFTVVSLAVAALVVQPSFVPAVLWWLPAILWSTYLTARTLAGLGAGALREEPAEAVCSLRVARVMRAVLWIERKRGTPVTTTIAVALAREPLALTNRIAQVVMLGDKVVERLSPSDLVGCLAHELDHAESGLTEADRSAVRKIHDFLPIAGLVVAIAALIPLAGWAHAAPWGLWLAESLAIVLGLPYRIIVSRELEHSADLAAVAVVGAKAYTHALELIWAMQLDFAARSPWYGRPGTWFATIDGVATHRRISVRTAQFSATPARS